MAFCFHGQMWYYAIIGPKEYSMEAVWQAIVCRSTVCFQCGLYCVFINDGCRANNAQRHTVTKAIPVLALACAAFYLGIKGHWKIRANSDHSLLVLGQPDRNYKDLTSFHISSFSLLTCCVELACPDMLLLHKWAWEQTNQSVTWCWRDIAMCTGVKALMLTNNTNSLFVCVCCANNMQEILRHSATCWIKSKQGNSSRANEPGRNMDKVDV